MNEELKLLANHMRNLYKNIENIDEQKLEKLLNKDEIKTIYELSPSLITENSFYYIITKTNCTYIFTSEDDNSIKKKINSDIEFISVDERILDIIYSYDKLPIYNRLNGSKIKVLVAANDFSLIEWIGNYEPYVIVALFDTNNATWRRGTYFSNIIDAVNTYYNDFRR
ncbi:MAG: hypothetical protein HFJ52_08890 [Clostridia bacterium]|nr:hypothetical protein [Clostridia bacterium]